ncbi:recombinase family protein [bacterium]|nr:recombinase family protein [bacterium]
MGLREIAKELNEKGVPTTRGGKWYAGTIKYILENPLCRGITHYKDNKVKNKELAVV